MLQSARVVADGRGKLLTSAELINAAIFIPKRASYWWPFCCLHAQCTGREQCFGVERLSWSLFSNAEPLPAECLQCLCNFPSLTWESIPYKMLSMCYKKQSMLYIAFLLVFDVSINIPPSQYFYLKPWQSHGDLLSGDIHSACMQGSKSFLFSRLLCELLDGERKVFLTEPIATSCWLTSSALEPWLRTMDSFVPFDCFT